MSYLDNYLKNHKLGRMSNKQKKALGKIEKKLDAIVQNETDLTFEEIISKHSDSIVDIIERLKVYFTGWQFSFANMFENFRFIYSIALEVAQIVRAVEGDLKLDSLPSEKAHEVKVEFGVELTAFLWNMWDPFAGELSWLPFKKTVEMLIVRWLADMAIRAALDFFTANEEVEGMSVVTAKKKKGKAAPRKVVAFKAF